MRRQKDVQNERKKTKDNCNIIRSNWDFPFCWRYNPTNRDKQEQKSVFRLDPVLKKKKKRYGAKLRGRRHFCDEFERSVNNFYESNYYLYICNFTVVDG